MDDLGGREFDWFALDINGNIAVFSSAGNGTIPQEVKNNYKEYDSISDKFESPNWGSDLVWSDLANYGLYVFDWKLNNGPYIRKSIPKNKLSNDLKEEILSINELPILYMVFNETEEVSLWNT